MKRFKQQVTRAIYAPSYTSKEYIKDYLKLHELRFFTTAKLLKPILKVESKLVDLGTYGSLVPVFKDVFKMTDITCTAPLQEGMFTEESTFLQNAANGENYPYICTKFDLESTFPYSDEAFDVVSFTEVLEHLTVDPMFTMSEINRITRQGGHVILSTPNCASAFSLYKLLRGQNPFTFPVFIKNRSTDRHNREYTAVEVRELIRDAGFEIIEFHVKNVYQTSFKRQIVISALEFVLTLLSLLTFGFVLGKYRGDTIFVLAKKVSQVKRRYPDFLYYP